MNITGLFEELSKAENKTVIVEGESDKAALQKFGFCNVRAVNSTPLYKFVESIKEKEVVILTDLDREGRRIYGQLSSALQERGVRIDNSLRNALFKTQLRQIEGLPKYINKQKKSLNTTSKLKKFFRPTYFRNVFK
jgi:5S rRNA maturation endonuclease (ribonuclease M5)